MVTQVALSQTIAAGNDSPFTITTFNPDRDPSLPVRQREQGHFVLQSPTWLSVLHFSSPFYQCLHILTCVSDSIERCLQMLCRVRNTAQSCFAVD